MDNLIGAATSLPIIATDTNKFLYSDENLDRNSPEMWPEQVPGVVNFISGSCPIADMRDNSSQDLLQSITNPQEQSSQQLGTACGDSGHGSGSSEFVSVKKYSRSFDFTGYGLASSVSDKKKNGSGGSSVGGGDSDSEDRGSPISGIGGNCESNENSNRASPVNAFVGNTELLIHPSTSKPITNLIPKIERKPKSPVKTNIPPWQQGLEEEEIAMLYGFGSLTTSALLDKVKEIQNLAYQLGLEEEREMARARFLNVLGDCQAGETPPCNIFLSKNDLAFAEANTLNDSKSVSSSAKSSIANGITSTASNGTASTSTTSTKKKSTK